VKLLDLSVGEWEFLSKDGLPLYKSITILPLPDFSLEKIYLTRQETYALVKHTLTVSKVKPDLFEMVFSHKSKKDWVKWTSSKSCAFVGSSHMLCRTGTRLPESVDGKKGSYRLENVIFGT